VKALPGWGSPRFAIVAGRMSRLYDLMLLVDPNAPEERRNAVLAETESMINDGGGTLVANHDWGHRRMAYEIDHRPEADYTLYQFEGDNPLLDRLNQRLRIMDGLLRFRIIKIKPGQPTPPPPDQQAPRRRDDREAQDTRVAARAAADAPAADAAEDFAAPAADTAPSDAAAPDAAVAPADAPTSDAPTSDAPTSDAPAPDAPAVEDAAPDAPAGGSDAPAADE
jgi:small subunit ribosomal protein S6